MALGVNLLQLPSILLVPFYEKQVQLINAYLAGGVWKVMNYIFRIQGGKVGYSGDEAKKESAIVISNHVGAADIYLIHHLAEKYGMLPYCTYFAKDSLKYIPGFGWGLWLMGMLFLKRNWTNDKKLIDKAFNKIIKYKRPSWVISFVEGTRITKEKLAESREFSKERNLPVLNHVLIPRHKGFIATVRAFRNSHVKAVYDVTLAYGSCNSFQDAPSIFKIHGETMSRTRFHVHLKRYPITDLPEDEEQLRQWIIDRFVEKDARLSEMQLAWGYPKAIKM